MKKNNLLRTCFSLAVFMSTVFVAEAQTAKPVQYSSSELNSRMMDRRAVEAVVWGLPIVGQAAVKQAAFRD